MSAFEVSVQISCSASVLPGESHLLQCEHGVSWRFVHVTTPAKTGSKTKFSMQRQSIAFVHNEKLEKDIDISFSFYLLRHL